MRRNRLATDTSVRNQLGVLHQVRHTLAEESYRQLREALDDHDYERAAGLAALAIDTLVSQSPEASKHTRVGSALLQHAALTAALEVWYHQPVKQPRERVRRTWNQLRKLVAYAKEAQYVALESVVWLLQEQSEDALATLSALRDGRITAELQPLLASLMANVAYQQWLTAWNSQPSSSRTEDWRHDPSRWSRSSGAGMQLWRDASKQVASALKKGGSVELAYCLVHLHWLAGRQPQAEAGLAEIRQSAFASSADFHALRILLMETSPEADHRRPQAYLDLLKSDPWAEEALDGLNALGSDSVPPHIAVSALCYHLDVHRPGAPAVKLWGRLAGLLLREAKQLAAREDAMGEGSDSWQEISRPLTARTEWWGELHLVCPRHLPERADERQELAEKARCVALALPCPHFSTAVLRLFREAKQESEVGLLSEALTLRSCLGLGTPVSDPSDVSQQPPLSQGALLPLPTAWWKAFPGTRRRLRNQAALCSRD